MKSYFASYRRSKAEVPLEATVLVFDKNLSIGFRNTDGTNAMVNWLLKDVKTSKDPRSGQTQLAYEMEPGSLLSIEGNDAFDFIREMQADLQKSWYNKPGGREFIRNSMLFIGIIGVLFLLYLLIVPWLAGKMASRVSVKTEQRLGDAVYNAMDLGSQEDSVKTVMINEFFAALKIPTLYDIRISVVNDNTVNAFALPGGHIVVYSALLNEINTYPELAALLSHEFTHINNKHSTKSIFRQLGSKVFIGLLFGRFGTVSAVLVNHADRLKSLKYSRRLEKEADIEGLALLKQRQIDPAGFIDLFTHLKESGIPGSLPEFLGSHPDIDKRIDYIRSASHDFVVRQDEQLKAIFDKLKTN